MIKQEDLEQKKNKLVQIIKSYKKAAIAFSGGVDSTFLLKIAKIAIGNNCLAFIIQTNHMPKRELKEAVEFLEKENIHYKICEMNESDIKGFSENPENRCYLCKKELFLKMKQEALQHGIPYVLEGSNLDDMMDYRPGLAALQELEIKSPLRDTELSKQEIRLLSKELGLNTWQKPSYSCLATRIPYGELITKEKLHMIEQCENYLMELGFSQIRVRHHGTLARIEVERNEMEKLYDEKIQNEISNYFKKIGFLYTALDLGGYKMGNMNQVLHERN
ncbi:ATP-dependent sacrificial sulfur transferase LarE [Anaerosacchariphilus polymeriproducens]|uniref:ATP-dependent sacrificial sulfur transferase LarE n=1 Tax=Anaerosacchariphilus polymeriproducens TaxID=1812858 RepID=A0A371AWR7_9FIRM|nr:ATP-dependent sacrificial sulfur transferase LarE [Anaerosacchariphilus polymeriproducens]RDU24017.1 ATP-dependent sacrificial sulfur transferase LarE [Anaerosacchariphilus polymeriproducens]